MSDGPWENALSMIAGWQRRQAEQNRATRERVNAGEPFVLANQDEAEEVCNLMDIPIQPMNPWNLEVAAEGRDQYYSDLLEKRGYPGPHLARLGTTGYFPLGYAAALDPSRAPRGGLPKPTVMIAGGKFEMENRVIELWARAVGCPVFLMDFMFSSQIADLPKNWHRMMRRDWDKVVDPHRVAMRVEQEKNFVAFLERQTGRTFSVDSLIEAMELTNRQMDIWREAQDLIAGTKPCPVTIRDQYAIYTAVQLRGTQQGIDLMQAYLAEIRERVQRKVAAYPTEKIRLHYEGRSPPWHEEVARKYGAVIVSSAITGVPDSYAREIKNDDPFPALASRHMLLLTPTPERLVDVAKSHQCDGVIQPEIYMTRNNPSSHQTAVEKAGIPYLAVPRDTGDDEVKTMVTQFIERRLVR